MSKDSKEHSVDLQYDSEDDSVNGTAKVQWQLSNCMKYMEEIKNSSIYSDEQLVQCCAGKTKEQVMVELEALQRKLLELIPKTNDLTQLDDTIRQIYLHELALSELESNSTNKRKTYSQNEVPVAKKVHKEVEEPVFTPDKQETGEGN